MMEASLESNYWTPIAVAQALLGIWFAASHQPWIVGPRLSQKRICQQADQGLEPPFRLPGTLHPSRICRANSQRD